MPCHPGTCGTHDRPQTNARKEAYLIYKFTTSVRASVTELGSVTDGRPGPARHSRTLGFPPTGPAVGGAGPGPSQKAGRLSGPLHGWNGHGRSLVPSTGGAWPGGGALRCCRREKRSWNPGPESQMQQHPTRADRVRPSRLPTSSVKAREHKPDKTPKLWNNRLQKNQMDGARMGCTFFVPPCPWADQGGEPKLTFFSFLSPGWFFLGELFFPHPPRPPRSHLHTYI